MTTRAVRLIAGGFGTFAPGTLITGVPEAVLAEWILAGVAVRDRPTRAEPEMAALTPPETASVRRAAPHHPSRSGPLNPKET